MYIQASLPSFVAYTVSQQPLCLSCGSPRRLAQRIHPRHARPISDTPWPSAKSVVGCTPGGFHGKLMGYIFTYIYIRICGIYVIVNLW
jgi:hypothetical protein